MIKESLKALSLFTVQLQDGDSSVVSLYNQRFSID
jgi:hypothetical protein